ncbi:hypothetical protein BN7874_280 [Phage NCTB]|jgi:hypothetical protein|nr:hypothetical protein BN7874_280 [Phage NCTB]
MKKPSKNIEKLQNARSLNELMSVVDSIKRKITNVGKSTAKLLQGLSSTSTITINLSSAEESFKATAADDIELGDIKKKATRKAANKKSGSLRTVLDKSIKTPSTKQLARNSSVIEEITSSISDLEVAIRVLTSKQFSKMDESKSAVNLIKQLIAQAKEIKDTHLNALSKIASDFTPTDHKRAVAFLKKILTGDIQEDSYTKVQVKSFVLNPEDDIIYYQTFLLLRNLANKEGFIYEAYSYVLTGVLDTSVKEPELVHHLTTLKDPKVPGSFPIGSEVETKAALTKKVNALNIIDDLNVTYGGIKLKKSSADLQRSGLGDISPNISKYKLKGKEVAGIRVKNNRLYVRLNRGMSEKQKTNLLSTLIPLIKAIFIPGSRRQTVAWKEIVGKNTGAPFFVFALSRKEDTTTKEFIQKVNRLAKELKLSPMLSREIIQNVVNQYAP